MTATAKKKSVKEEVVRESEAMGSPVVPMKKEIKDLSIDHIHAHPDCQIRMETKEEKVQEYEERLRNGTEFPPLVVFIGETQVDSKDHPMRNYHFIGDGFHRYRAAKRAGLKTIKCEVNIVKNSMHAAVLHACGANDEHGIPRTNADKRRAVEVYWNIFCRGMEVRKSSTIIAKICKVTHTFVDTVIDEIETKHGIRITKIEGEDGRIYELKRKSKNNQNPKDVATVATSPHTSADDSTEEQHLEPEPDQEPEDAIDSEPEPDAEPEATPEPEQELDAAGVPIPEHVQPAFQFARQIIATCREIDAVVKKIEGFKTQFGGRLIRHDSAISQLKDARGNLFGNRCTHVCPYCFGTAAVCNACKGEGWTASHVWKSSPAAIKRS
jgi:uncharacterized ParB-like nuclease family protein